MYRRRVVRSVALACVAGLLFTSCSSGEESSRTRNAVLDDTTTEDSSAPPTDSAASPSPSTDESSTPTSDAPSSSAEDESPSPTVAQLGAEDEESNEESDEDGAPTTSEAKVTEPTTGESGGEIIVEAADDSVESTTTTSSTTTSSTTTTVAPDPNAREWIDDSIGSMKVGVPFSDGLAARGPGGVMAFILTNGTILPPGLSLNIYGGISGTPTKAGTYSFSIYVGFWKGLNGLGKSFTVTVEPADEVKGADPKWNDTHLGLMIERIAYSDGFSASPAPSSYSVSGDLPPGLTFNSATGELQGTPSTQGTYSFTISATYADATLTPLTVTATVTPSIDKVWIDSTLAPMAVGVPYRDGVTAAGGGYLNGTMRGVMCYIVPSGSSLPPGLKFEGCGGAIVGTPTTKGTFLFRIYAGFWSGSGLYLDFKVVIGDEEATTTSSSSTSSSSTSTTTSESSSEDSTTTSVAQSTTTSVSAGQAAAPQGGAVGSPAAPPTPQVIDVVSPNVVEAQVIPDGTTSVACDSSCVDLLALKGGRPDGDVYVRVGTNSWTKLERGADAVSFEIGADIANVQVKVVEGDEATLLFGQLQTAGAVAGAASDADGMNSSTIWYLLVGLLVVILVGVILQRRKTS